MSGLAYGTGDWDADKLGNHRVVIRVNQAHATAVQARIPWRRRDSHPERKRLLLIAAVTGDQVSNLASQAINREVLDLVFEPVSGAGDYYLYFMPYAGNVQAPYPQIHYLEAQETASPDWLASWGRLSGVKAAEAQLPQAEVLEIQSIDELSSFYPMEVIATQAEIATLLATYPDRKFFLFAEDRQYSIRMTDDLPFRWVEAGPFRPFSGSTARDEFFVFQIGLYAARSELPSVQIHFTDLQSQAGNALISAGSIRCFNLGGVDWTGRAFRKELTVPQGKVQALWFGIEVPADIQPGKYHGEVSIEVGGIGSESLPLNLEVRPELAVNHGDDAPDLLSRLRWLDSTIALDDEVTAPFTPIQVNGSVFKILGREIEIGSDGFPIRIQSYFAPEMTHITDTPRDILGGPVTFAISDSVGTVLPWIWQEPAQNIRQVPGLVAWVARGQAGEFTLDLDAELEFDGNLEYRLSLSNSGVHPIQLGEVYLRVPVARDTARYMLGLGQPGGKRPAAVEWRWDVLHKNQDSLWLGDVNAGLQITLKDENYSRPLNTNFYTLKPLITPVSWDNGGLGRVSFTEIGNQPISVICSSGPRTFQPGEILSYHFRLSITPYKPIDPGAHFSTRYYHQYSPVEEIATSGANTINIHHANAVNPFINYPFLRPEAMKKYIDQAHDIGLKVKIYYTVRELTNHAPELFALRSLGDEVLSDGPGGGHSWLQEHLDSHYVTGWHVYRLKDVAVVNSGTSRWHNFYLEGLNWLAQQMGIDGLYIDDLAFDRVVMKRVRKILDRQRPDALIDLHSANQFRERDGFASSANLYMEHFPYLNRLWFGEYFDYNQSPDYWLVEVSGIPFGLMGEMLQDGGNPWRGMVYGMTGRLPWSGDPRPMWQAWDAFGIQDSQMIGYWSPNCPVRTGRQDILATVYQKKDRAMIALATWASEPSAVTLQIDWIALGIEPQPAVMTAPAIENFQEADVLDPNAPIRIEPGKGWLLVLE